MYTSYIGKRFLEAYNRQNRTSYSAEEYFDKEFHPIFLNDEDYLIYVTNSPFVQSLNKDEKKICSTPDSVLQLKKEKFKSKVKNEEIDGSFAIGFQAKDYNSNGDLNTTTGQLSSININWTSEDIYCSWIGAALGIGIENSPNILIDDEEMLIEISKGWAMYRSFVNQTQGIDNKIEGWNGIWLRHYLTKTNSDSLLDNFSPVSVSVDGKPEMKKPTWIEMLYALSCRFGSSEKIVYVYQFGKTNTTIGFIKIYLREVKRIFQLYQLLFPANNISGINLSSFYDTQLTFLAACKRGEIGLRQLEPKDLEKYFLNDKKLSSKEYRKAETTFNIYYTWIIAMLNNKDILRVAIDTAKILQEYVSGESRAKRTRPNEIEEIFHSKTKRNLIEALVKIVKAEGKFAEQLNLTVDTIHLEIPNDNIPYFVTLLKFKYNIPELNNALQ